MVKSGRSNFPFAAIFLFGAVWAPIFGEWMKIRLMVIEVKGVKWKIKHDDWWDSGVDVWWFPCQFLNIFIFFNKWILASIQVFARLNFSWSLLVFFSFLIMWVQLVLRINEIATCLALASLASNSPWYIFVNLIY